MLYKRGKRIKKIAVQDKTAIKMRMLKKDIQIDCGEQSKGNIKGFLELIEGCIIHRHVNKWISGPKWPFLVPK